MTDAERAFLIELCRVFSNTPENTKDVQVAMALQALRDSNRQVSLNAVSRYTGIPKTTVLRAVQRLQARNLVSRDMRPNASCDAWLEDAVYTSARATIRRLERQISRNPSRD